MDRIVQNQFIGLKKLPKTSEANALCIIYNLSWFLLGLLQLYMWYVQLFFKQVYNEVVSYGTYSWPCNNILPNSDNSTYRTLLLPQNLLYLHIFFTVSCIKHACMCVIFMQSIVRNISIGCVCVYATHPGGNTIYAWIMYTSTYQCHWENLHIYTT